MKVFKVFLLVLVVSNFSFGADGDRSRFNIECKNGEDAILSDCREATILSITNPKAVYYSVYVDKEKNILDKFDILEAKEGLVNINFGFYPPHYDVDYDKTTEFDFIDFKKNNGIFDIHLSRGKWKNLLEPWTADGIAIWMNVIKGISIISETIKAIPKAEEQNKKILKFLQENLEKFTEISNTIKNAKAHASEFFLALKASSNVIYNISNILNEAGHNPYKKEIDYIYFKTKNICRIGEEVLKITEKDFTDMDNDEKIHKIEMELLNNFFEEVDYEDIRKKIFKEANYEDIYNKILSLYLKTKKEKYIYLVLQPEYLEDGFSPKNILTIISAFVTLLDNNKLLEPLLKSTSDTGEYVTKTLLDTLFKSEFGPYYEIPKLANTLVPYVWDMATAPTHLTFHIEKGKIQYIKPPYLKSFNIRNENNEIIYQFPNKKEDLEVTLEPNQCANISYQVYMPDNFERAKEALDQWWTYIYDYEYIQHFQATLNIFFNDEKKNIEWDKTLFIKKSQTKYYWKLVNYFNGKKDIKEDLNEDKLNQIEPIFSKENILYNRRKICFDDNLPTQFRLHYFNFGSESNGKFVLNIKNKKDKDNSGFVDISKIDISKKTVKINENFTINFDLKEHNQGSKEFKSIEVWIQKLIGGEWKDQYMAESWKNVSFAPDEVKSFSSTTYLSSAHNRTAGDYRAVVRGVIEKDGKEDIFNFGAIDNGESFVAFKAIKGDDLISLTNGLVAHYQFEGNANDSSGNNNHGIEHGGVSYVDGVIGKAGSFDGIDDYIRITNKSSLNFGTSDFSISAFINLKNIKNEYHYSNGTILSKRWTNAIKTNGLNQWILSVYKDKGLFLQTYSYQWSNINAKGITFNNFYHIVASRKNGILSIYINGKLTEHKSLPVRDVTNPMDLFIGVDGRELLVNYDSKHFFNGLIDDLRIYNRALNEVEIAELYKMGNKDDDEDSTVANKTFDGIWEGNGEQTSGSKWSIKITIDSSTNEYKIDYPSLNCGGTLTLLSKSNTKIEFHEKITYGINRCVDNGTTVLTKTSENKADFSWYYSNGKLEGWGKVERKIDNIDSDGDGISDKREEELGLNPNSKDSDGDGVEDGADLYPLDPNKTGQEDENSESDTSYQIDDNKLSNLIKKRLKLPSDAVLTKGDLLKVKRLHLKNKKLTSENIKELNKLNSLEILDLSSNKIKDISALKNLKNLRILNLSKNRIEDISPLEDLTNLTHLKLTSNPIKSNIATLSKLTKLERLLLNKTDIEGDMSALSDMKDLKYLILSKTKLRGDIASLENLKKLEYLYLKKLDVEGDISVFEEMTNMRKIYLNNTEVYGDISAFSNMLKVTHIKLQRTKVSGKKSSLKSLPKLKVLDVKRTNVE